MRLWLTSSSRIPGGQGLDQPGQGGAKGLGWESGPVPQLPACCSRLQGQPLHSRCHPLTGWLGHGPPRDLGLVGLLNSPTATVSIRGGVAPQSRSGYCDQDKGTVGQAKPQMSAPPAAHPHLLGGGLGDEGGAGPHTEVCAVERREQLGKVTAQWRQLGAKRGP